MNVGPSRDSKIAEAADENSRRGKASLSAACNVEVLGGGMSEIGASHGSASAVSWLVALDQISESAPIITPASSFGWKPGKVTLPSKIIPALPPIM